MTDWDQSSHSTTNDVSRSHSMRTRLQTGTIERRDYTAFQASLLELQSLKFDDVSMCYGGFSFFWLKLLIMKNQRILKLLQPIQIGSAM